MSTNHGISQTDFQKLMLLLSEKRTAHTTLRSGIALCAFSMTIISFILVMASKVVDSFQLSVFILPATISTILLILGIYFIRRGITRMQFHDRLIDQILYSSHEARSMFYHTRKRDKASFSRTPMHYDAVFHLDTTNADINSTIKKITTYFAAVGSQQFSASLVVTGSGISMLKKDTPHAEQLTQLASKGLRIVLCHDAIAQAALRPEFLIPEGRIVPSGLIELVELQRKGYAYLIV
ncbi:DsrE family protein [Halodesulfovibrio sp.]|jgi:intracellular sulfur oxidation DsrE/DsrF family protein|uniref:DsrE family protein n=1 Tax=Halodesulfovibrio sp. TaxID=1912772 RepID=UPI0025E448AB|nr:DsrE family protein [Halodesulfovibrio sp.]MCT4535591.1 DsrE family protein [Halodesulfovibrio sp.]